MNDREKLAEIADRLNTLEQALEAVKLAIRHSKTVPQHGTCYQALVVMDCELNYIRSVLEGGGDADDLNLS
jgi:hypothetical protein